MNVRHPAGLHVTFVRTGQRGRHRRPADLAYTVEIEHYQGQQFAGSDERHDFDLRVTTIFRREPVGWRIVHRHADGITTARPVESVLQR